MTEWESTSDLGELVSIGLPVYNGADSLGRALDSLVNQSHQNIEIIISDNASTDATAAICRRYGADSRVRYQRQKENLGAHENFQHVLHAARGAFFMWAADDDVWDRQYIAKNLAQIAGNPSIVGSVSRVRWQVDGKTGGLAAGTSPLLGEPRANIRDYMRFARDNSRFYGLFKRETLLHAYPEQRFYAFDIATMIGTLMLGNHAEVEEILLIRTRHDPNSYTSQIQQDNEPGIDSAFPLLPFTRHIIGELHIPLTTSTIMFLIARNLYEHLRQAATTTSTYGRLAKLVMRIAEPMRKLSVHDG